MKTLRNIGEGGGGEERERSRTEGEEEKKSRAERKERKWEKLNEANCRRPGRRHMINNNGFTTHFGKYFGNKTNQKNQRQTLKGKGSLSFLFFYFLFSYISFPYFPNHHYRQKKQPDDRHLSPSAIRYRR